MSVGKRIYLQREMPDPEIVEQFKSIPASNTADVMGRSCAMNPRIHLVSKPKAQMMAGPAYTVKCRAGDNLTLHAALNFCQEGDVLVVSNGFHLTRARMLAERFGYGEVSTLAAPTSHIPSRIQMYIREPLALVKSFFLDR